MCRVKISIPSERRSLFLSQILKSIIIFNKSWIQCGEMSKVFLSTDKVDEHKLA